MHVQHMGVPTHLESRKHMKSKVCHHGCMCNICVYQLILKAESTWSQRFVIMVACTTYVCTNSSRKQKAHEVKGLSSWLHVQHMGVPTHLESRKHMKAKVCHHGCMCNIWVYQRISKAESTWRQRFVIMVACATYGCTNASRKQKAHEVKGLSSWLHVQHMGVPTHLESRKHMKSKVCHHGCMCNIWVYQRISKAESTWSQRFVIMVACATYVCTNASRKQKAHEVKGLSSWLHVQHMKSRTQKAHEVKGLSSWLHVPHMCVPTHLDEVQTHLESRKHMKSKVCHHGCMCNIWVYQRISKAESTWSQRFVIMVACATYGKRRKHAKSKVCHHGCMCNICVYQRISKAESTWSQRFVIMVACATYGCTNASRKQKAHEVKGLSSWLHVQHMGVPTHLESRKHMKSKVCHHGCMCNICVYQRISKAESTWSQRFVIMVACALYVCTNASRKQKAHEVKGLSSWLHVQHMGVPTHLESRKHMKSKVCHHGCMCNIWVYQRISKAESTWRQRFVIMVACATYGCTNSSRKQKAHEVKGLSSWLHVQHMGVPTHLESRKHMKSKVCHHGCMCNIWVYQRISKAESTWSQRFVIMVACALYVCTNASRKQKAHEVKVLSSWLHVQHMGVPTHLESRKHMKSKVCHHGCMCLICVYQRISKAESTWSQSFVIMVACATYVCTNSSRKQKAHEVKGLSSWLHVQHMGVPTHLESRKHMKSKVCHHGCMCQRISKAESMKCTNASRKQKAHEVKGLSSWLHVQHMGVPTHLESRKHMKSKVCHHGCMCNIWVYQRISKAESTWSQRFVIMVACATYGCTNASRKQKAHEVKGLSSWLHVPYMCVPTHLESRKHMKSKFCHHGCMCNIWVYQRISKAESTWSQRFVIMVACALYVCTNASRKQKAHEVKVLSSWLHVQHMCVPTHLESRKHMKSKVCHHGCMCNIWVYQRISKAESTWSQRFVIMVACATYGCTNASRKQKAHGVKGWHYIPREEVNKELRNQWIISIKREPPYPKDENIAVCGLHFEDECFIRDFYSENSNLKSKLKDGFVPTKFVFSKQKQKRRSSEQRAEKLYQHI